MEGFSRRTDPQTSRDAAASIDVSILERQVLRAIKQCGKRGATWDELHYQTGIRLGSISPRFRPLRSKGLIESRRNDHGEVVKRRGVSKRHQTVWFAVDDPA